MRINGDSLKDAPNEIKERKESKGAKEVFKDWPILDYLRNEKLPLDVTSKRISWILQ